jgi:hypothetical protein
LAPDEGKLVFPAFFAFAHLAFATADSAALPAAVNFLLAFRAPLTAFAALILAFHQEVGVALRTSTDSPP